ncbi:hypothetical protein ScPMuIL_013462 [Solemya velum]
MSVDTLNPYFERMLSGQTFETGEDYKFELIRLKTFSNWPADNPVSSIRLAQAGFYSTGNFDEVACFSCNSRKQNWQMDDNPLAVHRSIKPDCPFITGQDSGNVPITNESTQSNQFSTTSLNFNNSRQRLRNPGEMSYHPQDASGANVAEGRPGRVGLSSEHLNGLDISVSRLEEIGSLRYEMHRLETFRNWPQSVPVSKEEVARAGMYYTGLADRCQCVFCKGMLRNWEPGDVPRIEHAHHFPRCPFILGLNVGNVPIAPTSQSEGLQIPSMLNSQSAQSSLTRMEALGVNTERPRHPQYAVEAVRVSSFQNWPTYKSQTPQMLAKCGFYYAGFGDNVKCFFCDGGLRNWESGDDPWVEHARWFPRCAFVRQCKGEDFVKDVQTAVVERRQELSSSCLLSAAHHIEEREVCARLDRPAVQAVLEMGFTRDLVKKAIEKRLTTTGDDFPNAETLVEAIFVLESQITLPGVASNKTGVKTENPESTSSSEKRATNDVEQRKDDAVTLVEENRQLKEQRMCKVCMDEEVSVVFLPCGHLVCCPGCAPAMRKCPICRKNIKGSVRTYLS